MNQIIMSKPKNKKHRNLFKIQFIISILIVIILAFYYIKNVVQNRKLEGVSQVLNQSFELETMYSDNKSNVKENNKYFGKIIIPKIDLEYSIFNECNEELLKVLPCKFYGVNFGEKGNIAIAGHNYEDNRFFGNLNKLKKGDIVYLEDLVR